MCQQTFFNVEKSNFVTLHPPQKKLAFDLRLFISNNQLKQENCIKYLGMLIDSNLNLKSQINYITKKIKRNIGMFLKHRHYIGLKILVNFYYALVYPFLIYGIIVWGNVYPSTLKPVYILLKKTLHIITFSKFGEPSSPLFISLNIIMLLNLVNFHTEIFMYKISQSAFAFCF